MTVILCWYGVIPAADLHSYNENYDTMHFNSDEHVILIGKVMGIVEEKDLASDEHIELYRVLHPEDEED